MRKLHETYASMRRRCAPEAWGHDDHWPSWRVAIIEVASSSDWTTWVSTCIVPRRKQRRSWLEQQSGRPGWRMYEWAQLKYGQEGYVVCARGVCSNWTARNHDGWAVNRGHEARRRLDHPDFLTALLTTHPVERRRSWTKLPSRAAKGRRHLDVRIPATRFFLGRIWANNGQLCAMLCGESKTRAAGGPRRLSRGGWSRSVYRFATG